MLHGLATGKRNPDEGDTTMVPAAYTSGISSKLCPGAAAGVSSTHMTALIAATGIPEVSILVTYSGPHAHPRWSEDQTARTDLEGRSSTPFITSAIET